MSSRAKRPSTSLGVRLVADRSVAVSAPNRRDRLRRPDVIVTPGNDRFDHYLIIKNQLYNGIDKIIILPHMIQ
jgi:hypothetical protein